MFLLIVYFMSEIMSTLKLDEGIKLERRFYVGATVSNGGSRTSKFFQHRIIIDGELVIKIVFTKENF